MSVFTRPFGAKYIFKKFLRGRVNMFAANSKYTEVAIEIHCTSPKFKIEAFPDVFKPNAHSIQFY